MQHLLYVLTSRTLHPIQQYQQQHQHRHHHHHEEEECGVS
jgi:hypothetical protein